MGSGNADAEAPTPFFIYSLANQYVMMSWPRKKSSVAGIRPRSKSKYAKKTKNWNSMTEADHVREIREQQQIRNKNNQL